MYIDSDGLSERKKMILKAIIDLHIENGEPIGSKFLVQNNNIKASSATIRNEMAELEERGFLEQPHTSAGRVPSELGYRFYVDSLMRQYQLTRRELEELDNLRRAKAMELDKIMEQAGRLVAMMTNYTSLMVKPRPASISVSKFKLIKCDIATLILIMVVNESDIKTRYVRIGYMADESEILRAEEILNRFLVGIARDDITLALISKMEAEAGAAATLMTPLAKAVYDAMEEIADGDIKLEGVNRLLGYSDYTDREELSGLMGLSEKKEDIINTISKSPSNAVNVYIGRENPIDIMKNSTMIFRTIKAGGRVVGAIGVIGPCRMAYNKVISTINHMSKNIADLIDGSEEGEEK